MNNMSYGVVTCAPIIRRQLNHVTPVGRLRQWMACSWLSFVRQFIALRQRAMQPARQASVHVVTSVLIRSCSGQHETQRKESMAEERESVREGGGSAVLIRGTARVVLVVTRTTDDDDVRR